MPATDTATETFIRESFLRVAHAKKQSAASVSDEQLAQACDLSREMHREHLALSAGQIADKDQRYTKYRASLTFGGIQKRPIDPTFFRIWEALQRRDAAPLFDHYKCYLTR